MAKPLSWLAMISLICTAAVARADEGAGVHTRLFNGHDLAGWHVTGCEAVVEDGLLVLKSGDGLVRTDHRYGDFVLDIDWRPLREKDYDCGIYFRAELPPKDQPWPKRYQANLKQGREGNVGGLEGAESSGLAKPGEWNHFKLTVIGHTAALEINGKKAWKTDAVEPLAGYIGLQAEVAGGGQFQFRNIEITELGYRPLFNGKDLAGWEGAGKAAALCWAVDNEGLLMCTGAKGPWLRSDKQYDDFNLRLNYKLLPGGNSGVYVRVPESGNHHGPGSGVEIQVLDDGAERYKGIKPYQYTGSVYDIMPARHHVARPAGQWNALEINCKGMHYTITHNGVVIVDGDEKEFPLVKERRLSGYLGLQNHSEKVWYRNIRLGPPLE